jgi:hypothetical protein
MLHHSDIGQSQFHLPFNTGYHTWHGGLLDAEFQELQNFTAL